MTWTWQQYDQDMTATWLWHHRNMTRTCIAWLEHDMTGTWLSDQNMPAGDTPRQDWDMTKSETWQHHDPETESPSDYVKMNKSSVGGFQPHPTMKKMPLSGHYIFHPTSNIPKRPKKNLFSKKKLTSTGNLTWTFGHDAKGTSHSPQNDVAAATR